MKTLTIIIFFQLSIVQVVMAAWTDIHHIFGANLYGGCHASNGNTAFIGADNGLIFHTNDAGQNWDSVQTIFTNSWILDIDFPSVNVGYACGGTAFGPYRSCIVKTMDGGITWDSISANSFGYEFAKIQFLSENLGYVAGDQLIKTVDGGSTFTLLGIPANQTTSAMYFADSSKGFICTNEYVNTPWSTSFVTRILMTIDGGNTWNLHFVDTADGSFRLHDIYFTNPATGYAIGDNGRMLRSLDGGVSWSIIPFINSRVSLKELAVNKNSTVAYIVGSIADTGYIFKSTDQGAHWTVNFTSYTEALFSIAAVGTDTAYACGYSAIYKTSDAGQNVSVSNRINRNDVCVFPNPSDGTFQMLFSEDDKHLVRYTISNFFGQVVVDGPMEDASHWISVQLPAGSYVLTIHDQDEQKLITKKIIINSNFNR